MQVSLEIGDPYLSSWQLQQVFGMMDRDNFLAGFLHSYLILAAFKMFGQSQSIRN